MKKIAVTRVYKNEFFSDEKELIKQIRFEVTTIKLSQFSKMMSFQK